MILMYDPRRAAPPPTAPAAGVVYSRGPPGHDPTATAGRAPHKEVPIKTMDDETALKVVDGNVEVISEGHWKLLTP